LKAWQKGMDLATRIYEATRAFPKEERYGLSQQLQRACVSVPANIAEGWGRSDRKDYVRFLRIARGSLFEAQTHLLLAGRLGYLTGAGLDEPMELSDECSRILHGLIKSLIRKDNT